MQINISEQRKIQIDTSVSGNRKKVGKEENIQRRFTQESK